MRHPSVPLLTSPIDKKLFAKLLAAWLELFWLSFGHLAQCWYIWALLWAGLLCLFINIALFLFSEMCNFASSLARPQGTLPCLVKESIIVFFRLQEQNINSCFVTFHTRNGCRFKSAMLPYVTICLWTHHHHNSCCNCLCTSSKP